MSVAVLVRRRYGDEWHEIREWIRPTDWMVRAVAQRLSPLTPLSALNWIIAEIRYPPGPLALADLHTEAAYPRFRLVPWLFPLIRHQSDDFWSWPAETLRDRIGDCEDRVALLTSLLRAAGWSERDVWATVGLYGDQGHAWVTVRERIRGRERMVVLETTLERPATEAELWPEAPPYTPWFRFNDVSLEVVQEAVRLPVIHTLGGRRLYLFAQRVR